MTFPHDLVSGWKRASCVPYVQSRASCALALLTQLLPHSSIYAVCCLTAVLSCVFVVVIAARSCIVNASAVLSYFQFGRPFWATFVILAGYLLFMHCLTYGAMRLLARREVR